MVTKELIEKYHSGLCTPEEKKKVEEWLKSPSHKIDLSTDPEDENTRKEIWSQLEPVVSNNTTPTIPLHRRIVRYAAAVIVLCVVGFSIHYSFGPKFDNSETQVAGIYQTVQTQRGEKRTVTLPDGSTIRMNYETEIKVPEQFEGDQRIVYLTGHAHFDVARDTERPFIIYTEDTKTQVLGTSFDINTKEEGTTEIIVTSGKVAFSEKARPDNRVTLTVNDRALLNTDKNLETNAVDALALTAWKDNRLVFDGQTLREIIEVLEPWYDVRITVENPDLLEEDFILSLDNPPLESVLEDLSFASGLNYRIENKKVTIF